MTYDPTTTAVPRIRATTRTNWTEQHQTRPTDCNCYPGESTTETELPCFACYRAGFRQPNPTRDEADR